MQTLLLGEVGRLLAGSRRNAAIELRSGRNQGRLPTVRSLWSDGRYPLLDDVPSKFLI